VRRLALVLVAAVGLAACGGSSNHQSRLTQDKITSAYEKFFSPGTSVPDKIALLQNGPKFQSVVEGFAHNPAARRVSATVSSVTLQGANKAKVVYVVKLAGTPLGKQTGTAVRQDGRWKVGYASLCKLIALGGTTPSACKP
jgi:hypothetical protein